MLGYITNRSVANRSTENAIATALHQVFADLENTDCGFFSFEQVLFKLINTFTFYLVFGQTGEGSARK